MIYKIILKIILKGIRINKMKFNNIKKDWWLANSLLLFISTAFIFIENFISGNVTGGVIISGIEILICIALLQRSKIVFWLVFMTRIFNFLRFLSLVKTDITQLYSIGFLIIIVQLAFILMLWLQIRLEDKKSKN